MSLTKPNLDWLIATKVLGWKEQAVEYTTYMGLLAEDFSKHQKYIHKGVVLKDSQDQMHLRPPEYSTNIVTAMELFEHLRSSGKWCCLEIHSDYDYVWTVSLTESELTGNNPEHKVTHVSSSEKSLPMAICLVTLKSVEYTETQT